MNERDMVNMKINMKRRKKTSFHKSLFLLTMMKKNNFIRSSQPLVAMKKKKRTLVKKSSQQQQSIYLPDDCWNHVFAFLINAKDKKKSNFKSLSLVSKHFLAITNRVIFSMTTLFSPSFLPYIPQP